MRNIRTTTTIGILSFTVLFAATLTAGAPPLARSTDVAATPQSAPSIQPFDRFDVADWNEAAIEETEVFTSRIEPIPYTLVAESWALYGCWNPCKCPVLIIGEMYGGFDLELISAESDLVREYAVKNVSWDVYEWATWDYLYTVTGSGTYTITKSPTDDPTQRLILTLEYYYGMLEDEFDSGEVPLTDEFSIEVANNDFYCLNDAFRITAVPTEQ